MHNKTIITVPTREKKMIIEYAVKNIKRKTKMVIPQGYEVVLIDGDQNEVYTSGEHVFQTNREAPLAIYFINKAIEVRVGFGADDLGLYLFDSYLKMPIEVRVDGSVSFRVADGLKLVSQFSDPSAVSGKRLFETFKAVMYMEIKVALAKLMESDTVNIFNTTLLLKQLSEELHETLRGLFEPIGVDMSRFLITCIRTTDTLKEILDEEYQIIQRQTIKDVYNANKEKNSLATYEEKARIYRESGYCGLTEVEKDNEMERTIKVAGATDATYAPQPTVVPVSPVQPQHIASNTIYRAPEVSVESTHATKCDVCGENLKGDEGVCPVCGIPVEEV